MGLPYVMDVTHSTLKYHIQNSYLIPGQKYRITDFRTRQYISQVNMHGGTEWSALTTYSNGQYAIYGTSLWKSLQDNNTNAVVEGEWWTENWDTADSTVVALGPTEPLIVTAITDSELSIKAESELYPTDVIEYLALEPNPNPYLISWDGADRGKIVRRYDVYNQIDVYQDWRVCLVRLWETTPGVFMDLGGSDTGTFQDFTMFNMTEYDAGNIKHVRVYGQQSLGQSVVVFQNGVQKAEIGRNCDPLLFAGTVDSIFMADCVGGRFFNDVVSTRFNISMGTRDYPYLSNCELSIPPSCGLDLSHIAEGYGCGPMIWSTNYSDFVSQVGNLIPGQRYKLTDRNNAIVEAVTASVYRPYGVTWEDLPPSSVATVTGPSSPSVTVYNGDTLRGYEFVGTGVLVKELQLGFQLRHSYVEGSDIVPHLHLYIPDNVNGGDIKFYCDYTWTNVNDADAAEQTLSGSITRGASAGVNGNAILSFGTVTGTGMDISSIFSCRIYRDPGDDDDTFEASVWLKQADIHFQADSIGSLQPTSKL